MSIAIVSFIAAFIGGVFSLNSSPFFFVFLYAMTGINAALAYMKLKKENQKMENLHKIDTQKVIEKKQIESKLNDYRDKLFKLLFCSHSIIFSYNIIKHIVIFFSKLRQQFK